MNIQKKILPVMAMLLALAVSMTGCNTSIPQSEQQNGDITRIQLQGNKAESSSSNATYQKNTLYIMTDGVYELTGELKNSVIEVNAEKKDNVHLILNGVTVENETGPAIYVKQAGSVTIETAEGTVNTLSMGTESSDEKADGTIYSKDDLALTGSGTLVVTTGYKHAIVCNDTLVVEGGTYQVEAVDDGLHVNDAIEILGGKLDLQVGDDAIHVKNDEEKGTLHITDGDIYIAKCFEGLEAHEIVLDGGTIFISTTDDGINACGDRTATVTINGGDISILHEEGRDGDGVDSNGSITMNGGTLRISMNDATQSYALDCDGACTLNGGTVLACGSAGMAACFDEDAAQGFLQKNVKAEADTTVVLKDASGKVLMKETVPYAFSNIVLTTPEMKVGETCTLTIGDNSEEVEIDNTSDGAMKGGFGGFNGNRGEKPDGTFDGSRGEKPEDFNPGERGERPEGAFNGTRGEKPEDFNPGNRGERPQDAGDRQWKEASDDTAKK